MELRYYLPLTPLLPPGYNLYTFEVAMPGDVSRRGFVKTGTALATTAFGFDLRPAQAAARELKIARTTQTHSICPYCAVGCSVVIHTLGDKAKNVKPTVVHIEGDPSRAIRRVRSIAGRCVPRAFRSRNSLSTIGG